MKTESDYLSKFYVISIKKYNEYHYAKTILKNTQMTQNIFFVDK